MKFFAAGDLNSNVVVYYFGGHNAAVASERHPNSGAIRSVLSKMPPSVLSVSLKIGSWSNSTDYNADPALAEFFGAFDAAAEATVAAGETAGMSLPPNHTSVFSLIEQNIIEQAYAEQFNASANPEAVRELVNRVGRMRIVMVFSGGFQVFKKMNDRNFFTSDASVVHGVIHLDSLYAYQSDVLQLARETQVYQAAAFNDSVSSGGGSTAQFDEELNEASHGISIHTDSSHNSIPGEFGGTLVGRILMLRLTNEGLPGIPRVA